MAMSDEVREQRAKLKDASLWQKFCYYFGYYKWHVIIAAVLIFLLVATIYQTITGHREELLYGVFFNANTTSQVEAFQDDFGERLNINWKKQKLVFNIGLAFDAENWDEESYNSNSLVVALVQMNDLDFICAQETEFNHFAQSEFFVDLKSVLPDDVKAMLTEDDYYYYEDEMGDSHAIGIHLDDCDIFEDYGIYAKHEVILGVLKNSERMENTFEFIRFLFE